MPEQSEEMVDAETGISIEEISQRISEPETARALAKLFRFYYFDVHDINSFASSEYGGQRLDGLMNEIYSCFHHVARGLCEKDFETSCTLSEIKKAENTHLHRLVLDAYKVIVSSYIEEYTHVIETLKYYVLIEYCEALSKDSVISARLILSYAAEVKNIFKKAKQIEKSGDFDLTVNLFNQTIEKCLELREEIQKFSRSELYLLALAKHEAEQEAKKKEKRSERWWQLGVSIILLILGFMLGITSDVIKDAIKSKLNDSDKSTQKISITKQADHFNKI